MGVAALISWLVTALFGLYLLAVWLIEYDVTGEGAPASRLPTPVILGHVLFALTGVGSICCCTPTHQAGPQWGSWQSSPRWA